MNEHSSSPALYRRLCLLVAGLLVLVTFQALGAPTAQANQARLREAVRKLPVAAETNAGYERTKFRHWVDANRDCQNTRAEVLVQESKVAATGGCTIKTGRWVSYYDRAVWRRASDVDIDHLVALAEAWGSGARGWTADTRMRFANDLGDRRSLVAVTDNVNQAKSAKDPAEWLPRYARCRYVAEWTAVKLRWRLKVNRVEKNKLIQVADGCRNVLLSWTPAKVAYASAGSGGGTATTGIAFTKAVYNPAGDERDRPNTETITVKNATGSRKTLTGFVLKDTTTTHRYKFPAFFLGAGASVVVHSGAGSNTAGHLYAGWGVVWNNSGDTATLLNANGVVVDRCAWTGSEAGGVKYC